MEIPGGLLEISPCMRVLTAMLTGVETEPVKQIALHPAARDGRDLVEGAPVPDLPEHRATASLIGRCRRGRVDTIAPACCLPKVDAEPSAAAMDRRILASGYRCWSLTESSDACSARATCVGAMPLRMMV